MSHELELTLLNTSPPVKRSIRLNDEFPAKALQGILETAFGRDSAHLDEWTVVLTLKPVSHQLGFSFSGNPPSDPRPLETSPVRVIDGSNEFEDFDYHYDYADFDDDDELYWRNRNQTPTPDPDIFFKSLIEEARKVASDKPWTVLDSEQLFLCEHPDDTEPFFVSIIGSREEEIGVIVRQGWDGFRQLIGERDEAIGEPFSMAVTFEEREDIPEEDLRFFKRLGCYFRGKRWPKFRIHDEGEESRLPGPVEAKLIGWLLFRVQLASSKARKGWEAPVPERDHEIAVVQDWGKETEIRKIPEWNVEGEE